MAEDLARLTDGRANSTSDLTSEEAASLIRAWQKLLKEKKAEAASHKKAAA
jgi:hypothetical protein